MKFADVDLQTLGGGRSVAGDRRNETPISVTLEAVPADVPASLCLDLLDSHSPISKTVLNSLTKMGVI